MQNKILIVDDEEDIRNLVKGILEDEGYAISLAANSDEAYAEIENAAPHLIILDIWLQGSAHDGLEILANVVQSSPHIPILMISGHGTIETAVAAIKEGAYDFIEKPFKADRLLLMVQRALETAALKRENSLLKKHADEPVDLTGDSAFVKNLKDVIRRVSSANSRVLLTGEAGTGKDIVARMIHRESDRADQPFLVVNCGSLKAELLEAELFGEDESVGALETADQGTLLLDEVSEMPMDTQSKLLRVLQDGHFKRVGGKTDIKVDVRVLASSNHNLEQAIEAGRFKQDLYYRLNVVPIAMLPLRERAQDIKAFVPHFLNAMCKEAGVSEKSFSEDALRILMKYDWPGNVRQLKNVLEWVMIFHGSQDIFDIEHLPPELTGNGPSVHALPLQRTENNVDDALMELPLREAREAFERSYLFSQIDRFDGNISKTAQFIGMERSALHRKLKSLQVSEVPEEIAAEPLKEKRA